MATRKPAGKKKPTVRKPAKPVLRKPAKPAARKPARPVARKTAVRKAAPARRPVARKATAGVRRTALPASRPATPVRQLTPQPRTTPTSAPQGDSLSGNAGVGGMNPPQQPSFYRPVEQAMATHTVKEGETLSHIALRYYGNAGERFYMHIYNANRATIGDSPNLIKAGQELTIPKPPAE